jgi:hypothetical protein
MDEDVKPISADELYDLAGIAPSASGATAWGEDIPSELPGVYVIVIDDIGSAKFKDFSPEHELQRWRCDQNIIYIGRTHSKGGLKKRLRQFRYHICGNRSPHRGGQAILLLDCTKTIHWAAVEDDAGAEHKLIEAFRQRTKRYPFGNRKRSRAPEGAG